MTEDSENKTNDASILLNLPEDDRDEFQKNTDNQSETLRRLLRAYNQAEGKYEVGDDLEYINVLVLKTYRNAIEQNIQVLENQVDKIDEELEKFEKEEEDNVMIEIDLDIATKNL